MDHLPPLTKFSLTPLEVLYLDDDGNYDHNGFCKFPARKGWIINPKTFGDDALQYIESKATFTKKLAFLQSWLFFGMIIEVFKVFGVSVNTSCFLRWHNGQWIITTALLRSYIDEWARRREESCKPSETRESLVTEAQAVLVAVQEVDYVLFHSVLENVSKSDLQQGSMIALSISIMRETLLNALWTIESPSRIANPGFRILHPVRTLLRSGMRNSGWCLAQLTGLEEWTDTTGLYLASLAGPVHRQQEDHSTCTVMRCLGNQINMQTYETRHTIAGCTCQHVAIDPEEIATVLQRGMIPRFIVLADEERATVKLKIVEDGPFVAISHVWSHGLGNPRQNSLPRCQILRLENYITGLQISTSSPLGIWIDTLCVPVAPKLRHFRTLAIIRLFETFQKADKVLVLDTALEQTTKQCSPIELGIVLYCCGWMQRLWTFQEGLIGGSISDDKLHLRLLEGPIEWSRLLKRLATTDIYHSNITARDKIKDRLPREEYWQQRAIGRRKGSGLAILEKIGRELEHRTTTRPEDEITCLAGLLGLDTAKIVQNPTYFERLREFYILLRDIPQRVLFSSGAKMSLIGVTWAPNSISGLVFHCASDSLVGVSKQDLEMTIFATCSDHGLLTKCSGYFFKLDLQMALNVREISFLDPLDRDLMITLGPYPSYLSTSKEWNIVAYMREFAMPAILVNPDEPLGISSGSAVLVDVTHREENILFANYKCKVKLRRVQGPIAVGISHSPTEAPERAISAKSEQIQEDQEWCIM